MATQTPRGHTGSQQGRRNSIASNASMNSMGAAAGSSGSSNSGGGFPTQTQHYYQAPMANGDTAANGAADPSDRGFEEWSARVQRQTGNRGVVNYSQQPGQGFDGVTSALNTVVTNTQLQPSPSQQYGQTGGSAGQPYSQYPPPGTYNPAGNIPPFRNPSGRPTPIIHQDRIPSQAPQRRQLTEAELLQLAYRREQIRRWRESKGDSTQQYTNNGGRR